MPALFVEPKRVIFVTVALLTRQPLFIAVPLVEMGAGIVLLICTVYGDQIIEEKKASIFEGVGLLTRRMLKSASGGACDSRT